MLAQHWHTSALSSSSRPWRERTAERWCRNWLRRPGPAVLGDARNGKSGPVKWKPRQVGIQCRQMQAGRWDDRSAGIWLCMIMCEQKCQSGRLDCLIWSTHETYTFVVSANGAAKYLDSWRAFATFTGPDEERRHQGVGRGQPHCKYWNAWFSGNCIYWRMGTQTQKLGWKNSPASLWRCPLRYYYWSSCCRPSSLRISRQAINIWAVPNCSTSFWPLAKATVQSKRSMLKDLALGDLSRWQLRCYMGCKGSRWHPLPYSGSLTIPNLFCWLRQQYKASITQKEEERAALKTSKKGRIGLCIHLLCSEQSCG